MEHHFNIDVAKEYGIIEAILINHFQFWLKRNMVNGEHFHDGTFWTYNSVKAYQELFPYASSKQIRTALGHLINAQVIKTGNYNTNQYDRTLWYTFVDMDKWICQKGKMDLPDMANGDLQNGKCNTDVLPNIDTDNNTPQPPKGECASESVVEVVSKEEIVFDEFRKMYKGTKRGLKTEFDNFKKKHKDWRAVLPTLKPLYEKQQAQREEGRQMGAFVPQEKNLQTYINQRCWEDELNFATQSTKATNTAMPRFMTPEGRAEQKKADQFINALWNKK